MKISTELARALRVVATLVAIVASSKTLVWPYIQQKMFSGPAVEITEMVLLPAQKGHRGLIHISVNKLRPCRIKTAAISIVDHEGNEWPIENNLGSVSLRVAKNQKPTFEWLAPFAIEPGNSRDAYAEIWHHQCADGPDPKYPVFVNLPPVTIKP